MKLNIIFFTTLFTAAAFAACNDQEYVCNDPNADLNAPAYHDVNDLYQTYNLFWKPAQGWVGDPMPFYENGKFHVFYLHDARDGAATFHPIALTSTTDFTSYEDKGIVIPCGADNSQEDALGTGSVIKVGDTYYAYYTGHNGNLNPAEKIYLATSKDMKQWTKQKDFVLEAPQQDVDRNEFRDPFLMKDGNVYKMLVTSRGYVAAVNDWQAVILQYSSTDMLHWTLEEPFYFNGERILECPDVFTMGNYQYLVYSNWDWAGTDRRTRYVYRTVGSSHWTTPAQPALDDHYFYAGKTASDGTNRYLFGWCYTRAQHNDNKDGNDKEWAGSLVVHQLTQNSDGTLNVTVPASIVSKFNNRIALKALVNNQASVQGNTYTLKGSDTQKALAIFEGRRGAFKITAKVKAGNAKRFGFEFGASGARNEVHDLVFDTTNKQLKLDHLQNGTVIETRTAIALSAGNEFDVTILVENAVCTTYINGEKALTNRIYQMNWNGWGVFAEGGDAEFTVEAHQ